MKIAAETLTADQAYRLLVGSIIPRPIAWITTITGDKLINAAPFSAFTFVSNNPPMVCVSIGRKNGVLKDTAANIARSGEFVVNIGKLAHLDQLHATAREYPCNVSEVSELDIKLIASDQVAPPRIQGVPVALECRLYEVREYGDARTGLHIGEVLMFHVDDTIIFDGKIDSKLLEPIGRLAGPRYVKLGDVIEKPRVSVTPK